MLSPSRRNLSVGCSAALVLSSSLLMANSARAGISSVDMFRNVTSTQTGNGNTLTPAGAFLSTSLTSVNAGDYTAVQMTYPGAGSPQALAPSTPTVFSFQTALLPNQATMDAQYPFGFYTFNATGAIPGSSTFDYTTDDYALSTPFLTGTDFTDLQGMDAAAPFVFHLSPFITGGTASSSFIFFTIFDNTTNSLVFNDGFLAPTTTTITLPANTLTVGDVFTYELDYSNRDPLTVPVITAPAPDASTVVPGQMGFDRRTDGSFTTAAPSTAAPDGSSLGLFLTALLPGAGGLALRRRRRSA